LNRLHQPKTSPENLFLSVTLHAAAVLLKTVTVSGDLKTWRTAGRHKEQSRRPPYLYGKPPPQAAWV